MTERLHTGATPRLLLALAVLVAMAIGISGIRQTSAGEPAEAEGAAALAWLRDQQLDNGAYPGFSGDADGSATADAVYAFAAAGIHPETVTSDSGSDPIAFLRDQISLFGEMAPGDAAGGAAKVVLALHTAGHDPRTAGVIDLIDLLDQSFDTEAGTYGSGVFVHSLALMALAVSEHDPAAGAVATLAESQHEDGGWSFTGGTEPGTADSNTTALAIQALALFEGTDDAISGGVQYLMSVQASDGSFAFDGSAAPDLAGDANSTALAIQALVAAGVDLDSLAHGNPVAALARFQNPDGALHWQPAFPDDNFLATVQAIPAFYLQPLPIETVEPPNPVDDLIDAMRPAGAISGCVFHSVTSHNVCSPFQEYWLEHGALPIFGYPLTELFVQDGLEVQYFERAIFERHPDNAGTDWEVLLRRVGADFIEVQLEE